MALSQKGFLELEELKASTKYPSEERMKKGPIAIIECIQEIPCNPCEASCKLGAIKLGEPITNLPTLDDDKCIGCGVCVAQCPGLAIFIVDKSYSDTHGTVAFPYEYFPQPEKDQEVEAVDRSGRIICKGVVVKVQNPKSFDRTPVITISVPIDKTEEVRGIKVSLNY